MPIKLGASPRAGLRWTCPPNFCQSVPEIDANPGKKIPSFGELAKYGKLGKLADSVGHRKQNVLIFREFSPTES